MKFEITQALFYILLVSFGEVSSQDEYFVDPGVTIVEEWEGWGTSLAWWADVLGGMPDPVSNEVSNAFFHPDRLNLNIVRYVIGGTTPPEVEPYPCGDYRAGAASESFQDGPGLPFNWTRDARQRKILDNAKALGANIFEAFSNSPPQWMTISGCSKGNPAGFPLHANFLPAQAAAFADYATDVLLYFHNNLNMTFEYYEPFNEAMGLAGIGSWWGAQSSQEGCNMNRETMVEVVRTLYDAMQRKNLSFVTITAADETQVNTAVDTARFFNANGISGMISKLNVHGYWDIVGNRRDLLNILSRGQGQKLWMDEMGWAETPLNDMTQGFEVTGRILNDVRNMLPSAWVYWQVMEEIGSWGLLGLPYKDDVTVDDIQYNSGYYSMLQFSKYIKQGYRIIFINDENSLAAYDEASETLVTVTVHQATATSSVLFDLTSFSTSSASISSATRTSPSEQHSVVPPADFSFNPLTARLELTLPSESITTIVFSGVRLISLSPNLILNGDFESTNDDSWLISGGSGSLTDPEFPWNGIYDGMIQRNGDGSLVTLSQNLTVPDDGSGGSSRKLFLSLWVSTLGGNSRIEVLVDGTKVKEQAIDERLGYRLYGLDYNAEVGQSVTIQVANEGSSGLTGPIHVDDVQLHYSVLV